MRLIDSGVRPARWNVAMTAALIDLHRQGQIEDTLRFHRYERCVLLGRNQIAGAAANIGYCQARGIEIARRVTGGGAVYMSPSILAWDFVARRKQIGGNLDRISERLCRSVMSALCALGLAAEFNPPQSVLIGSKKISGSSGYADGDTISLQGTVIASFDAGELRDALRFESDPGDFVTSLERELNGAPDISHVRDLLRNTFTRDFGVNFVEAPHSRAEEKAASAIFDEEVGTDDFVYGSAVAPNERLSA